MLWLALAFPSLALELPGLDRRSTPWAVTEATGPYVWVHDANAPALAEGVRPGMPLSAARTLCATLETRPRNTEAEAESLKQLGLMAHLWTPRVSCQPSGLTLEIGASLDLFGGLAALRAQIDGRLGHLGHVSDSAVAPTPLGAQLLAEQSHTEAELDLTSLAGALDALPVEALPLNAGQRHRLAGFGLKRLGDCRALESKALAQRLGPEVIDLLERAYGDRPDPQNFFMPPEHFQVRLDLDGAVDTLEALRFPLRRLLGMLEGDLSRRCQGARTLELTLIHPRPPASPYTVELRQPSRDTEHLERLLRLRLEQAPRKQPVVGLALTVPVYEDLTAESRPLWTQVPPAATAHDRLVETLINRLGPKRVHQLRWLADPRPERAWTRNAAVPHSPVTAPPRSRPLWLCPAPVALPTHQDQPLWQGRALGVLTAEERIEAGWWDGPDQQRDYYQARTETGQRLWLYQDRRTGDWFLHGYFA